MRRIHAAARLLVVSAAALTLLALLAGPGGAHSATGTLGLEATPGATPLTARVRALLEYSNDREVAPGATVTVEARDTAGRMVGPQPMADQGRGLYETTLTLPVSGSWTVSVTAVNPAATGQSTVTVPEPTVATTPPTTVRGGGQVSGDLGGSSAPADDTADDADDADDGVSMVVIVGIVLVVGIAIGTAAAFARRRATR